MSKRIAIACDGTWNRPDEVHDGRACPTNVVKISRAIAPEGQEVFYERGVGTARSERLRGGMFGFGLSRNVRDCYRYLSTNYVPGDALYLFGFSRGAFTARSLAGFIGNSGILKPEHADRLDEAYELYRDREDPKKKPGGATAKAFRANYSHDEVPIRFVGVWDTVGALGIPLPVAALTKRWSFHDVRLGAHVETACHALSIDERRGPFQPTLWERQATAPKTQTLEQVWFSGVHSDVGGGYPDAGLADVPLRWMAARAAAAGLVLTPGWEQATQPDALGPDHTSFKGFYRLMRPCVRDLTHTDSGAASTSSWRRMRELPGYHPDNLRAYLATNPEMADAPG
jgi:uncharacterized protein (DUF2235 family)